MRQRRRQETPHKTKERLKMQLRLALGMTCSTSSCLAVDPGSATIAYPASGVTVLLDILQCRQKGYIHQAPQQISCVNFSPDGSLLLIGESGYMPALRVWWIQHEVELAKFQDHQYGIISASFSRKMDLVVSIGTKHDNYINVWAWPSRTKLSCNRFAEDIRAMAFSNEDCFFVTCGVHHIKFWYPIAPKKETSKYIPLRPHIATLYGRPALLGEIKHRIFADVVCGSETTRSFVFTVTRCGLVCKLGCNRSVQVYKRLQYVQLSSLQIHDDKLMVGSRCGHIYFFDASNLQLKASVSLPLDICFAEQVIRSQGNNLEAVVDEHRSNVYLAYDYKHCLLTAALTNGSLCVWDVTDWNNVKKIYYSVSHSNAISGLDIMRSAESSKNKETMVTVSHDATVRLWNIVMCKGISCESSKTIYTEFDRKMNSTVCPPAPQEGQNAREIKEPRLITSVKISPERDVIVTGDSHGLINVYDRVSLRNIKSIQRHTRGVTALDIFSRAYGDHKVKLLASGGRDRQINIFNMENSFALLNSLNIHSGTVTCLGLYSAMDQITLLSSGLDRSLVVCRSQKIIVPHFRPCYCRHPTSSIIDIVVCPQEEFVGVGRINGKVSILDSTSFMQIRRFNACPNENARLEKLQIHPKSNLMLSACTDKTINILNFTHGVVLATVYGHAKGISGLNFSTNMKFIVSTSRDGCIFIWGIPDNIIRSGIRVVRSALQAVEKQKSVVKTISVVRLSDLTNQSDPMKLMKHAKRPVPQAYSDSQSTAESFSERNADDDEEEAVSVEEMSMAEITDLGQGYTCYDQSERTPGETKENAKTPEVTTMDSPNSLRVQPEGELIEYITV